MITKKLSLQKNYWILISLLALVFFVSCNRENNERANQEVRESSDTRLMAPPLGDTVFTPVYVGGEKFNKMFVKDFQTKNGGADPRRYDRGDMMDITKPYIKRVIRGDNRRGRPNDPDAGVDSRTESILVYLDKKYLDSLMIYSENCTGLIAIFATDRNDDDSTRLPKNQTFILVPFNLDSGRAVPMDASAGIQGYERWPTEPVPNLTLEPMYQGGNIDTETERVYNALGIL